MNDSILDDAWTREPAPAVVEYPNFWRRMQAEALDAFLGYFLGYLFLGLYWAVSRSFIFMVLGVLAFPLYKIGMEAWKGATIGKRWRGIKVVSLSNDFGKISIKQAFGRSSFLFLLLAFYSGSLLAVHYMILGINKGFGSGTHYGAIVGLIVLFLIVLNIFSTVYFFYNDRRQTWLDKQVGVVCIKQ